MECGGIPGCMFSVNDVAEGFQLPPPKRDIATIRGILVPQNLGWTALLIVVMSPLSFLTLAELTYMLTSVRYIIYSTTVPLVLSNMS